MNEKKILTGVKQTYTAIAEEFDVSRKKAWPESDVIAGCLKKLGPGARLLDVGCGNGRLAHFLKNESIKYLGADNNKKLLAIAKKNNPKSKFRLADILHLPFPGRSFDAVCALAVLHHIPTKKLQMQALKELKRVLVKNGLAIITVWNLWQPKYKKYINRKTCAALIPWGQAKKETRFYHVFKSAELALLLRKAGFSSIKKYPAGNHNFFFVCHEKS